ncbi:MAG: fumarylacetoacetate hydrolase family protein [Thermodesulfobacteriota bacterium]|nr:fumarylacetoacetate hydrolase family protein [Thermodesulfobacteriota bacterium]
MRLVRFLKDGVSKYGNVEGNTVCEIEGDIYGSYTVTKKEYSFEAIKILPPCNPTKIIAIGLNYRDHAEEVKKKLPQEPMLFLKPDTSIIGDGDPIVYPRSSQRVDYEAELAFVIKREIKNIDKDEALDAVLGYTCFNDVTARDIQSRPGQFTRSKAFDTFAAVGPFIVADIDPGNLDIMSFLNGELKQSSNTKHLIFDIPYLVSFISEVMTLLPGDIIATGTPSGIGPMSVGDTIEVVIEGIGTLRNYVEAEYVL